MEQEVLNPRVELQFSAIMDHVKNHEDLYPLLRLASHSVLFFTQELELRNHEMFTATFWGAKQ